MKVRILWDPHTEIKREKQPFNGIYIDFERVPNKFETLTFSGITYIVKTVNTEIKGWDLFYTVYIGFY